MADAPGRPAPASAGEPALPGAGALRALSAACGLQLASFRAAHVARCVDRAVRRTSVPDADALAALIAREPEQRRRFRRAVAVSTTRMFRDAQQFDLLAGLLDRLQGPRPLRVWSVGASDGSELCSVALLLASRDLLDGATLLGSDLLEENVALAHERSHERLSPEQLATVRFERRDVVTSAPAGAWDVILCRNVLIHLSTDARDRLLRRAVDGLRPGGLLLLGRSERVTRPEGTGLRGAAANAYWRAG